MAQFKAFDSNVEVNGETVLSIVNAMLGFEDYALEILKKNGIENPIPGKFYSQQNWLNAFKEIAETLGDKTLFTIGKAIPANAIFPPEIDNLQKALSAIDMAYHMNHRNGEIGNYKLVSYEEINKKAVMECNNPYPSEFDRGIISTMARRFKPTDSNEIIVELDSNKPSRTKGADSCTYKISW